MSKIISLDLDGTILKDNKTVSERTIDTLLDCKEKGYTLVFNTGRAKSLVDPVLPQEFVNEIIVCSNGSEIFHKNKKIFHNILDENLVSKIITFFKEKYPEIFYGMTIDYVDYINTKDIEISKILKTEYMDFNERKIESTPNIFIVLWNVETKIKESILSELQNFNNYEIILTNSGDFVTLVKKGNNKLSGIKFVLDYKNLSLSDVIAFGDDLNDYEILKHSGVGVSMSNADEKIKLICNTTTSSNEEDGVAKYLEQYLLN